METQKIKKEDFEKMVKNGEVEKIGWYYVGKSEAWQTIDQKRQFIFWIDDDEVAEVVG